MPPLQPTTFRGWVGKGWNPLVRTEGRLGSVPPTFSVGEKNENHEGQGRNNLRPQENLLYKLHTDRYMTRPKRFTSSVSIFDEDHLGGVEFFNYLYIIWTINFTSKSIIYFRLVYSECLCVVLLFLYQLSSFCPFLFTLFMTSFRTHRYDDNLFYPRF